MIIECILKRPGGSRVTLDGVPYHFVADATGAHVCDVASRKHAGRLLGIEGYRLPPEDDEEDASSPAPQSAKGSQVDWGASAERSDDADVEDAQDDDPDDEAERPTAAADAADSEAEPPPAAAMPSPIAGAAPAMPTATEDMGRDTLVAMFVARTGTKPHHKMSIKSLVERING